MTEINVPRTFIDFWIFSHPYDPYFRPYAYSWIRFAVEFTNWCNFETVIPNSMSDHSEVHLHSFNLFTKTVSLALTMKDQFWIASKRRHYICVFIMEISHPYVYSRPYVYCFIQIVPPVRLFQTVRLFQSLEYLRNIGVAIAPPVPLPLFIKYMISFSRSFTSEDKSLPKQLFESLHR